MKNIRYLLIVLFFYIPFLVKAQIEKVTVETYYVSDANDATDTTDGRTLTAGSKTYRVYVDLLPGYKIKKIYGDANHALKIESTADFFNNIDRPTAWFGYLINKSWFPDNPTLVLDSWLTLGLATRIHKGVLKSEDSDSSFIGGLNNYGGTAGIAGGLLVNSDTSAGIPITVADGLMPNNEVLSQWVDDGFRDLSGTDTTVFGSVNSGSQFISNSAYLQQNAGVTGLSADSNKVLVAQLTTTGSISFDLNLELLDSSGNTLKFVANNDTLLTGETVSPYLKYPPACGCTDPNYLEYNPAFACGIPDSCHTLIVFGCMDTMACNYNPNANFNIQSLCCYPGYCNDRDIGVVCPELNNGRLSDAPFNLYPVPAQNLITLQVPDVAAKNVKFIIYNSFGRPVSEENIGLVTGTVILPVNISKLNTGLYLFRLYIDDTSYNKIFMKE